MANPFKSLASDTAVYGLSSIVARVLNFLLVPLYSYIISTSDFGIVSNSLAYIAILQVVLILGLETGCFRYAGKKQQEEPGAKVDNIFATAAGTILILCLLFGLLCYVFSETACRILAFDTHKNLCLFYFCGTLLLDCIAAPFYCRLRHEQRRWRFAIFKTVKILCELGANLVFFLVLGSKYFEAHPHSFLLRFISATPDYTYILFAIFISCLVQTVLFLPDFIRRGAFKINKHIWKPLMLYSIPLMIAGLPGIVNDMIDRILFRLCLGEAGQWSQQLGIFAACTKLAVLVNLFIQMFRYAAEPFFFGRDKQKGSLQLYATVLKYFTIFCVVAGLAIILYMDLLLILIGPDFRVGIAVAPIMVLAYILLGIYFNVSIWFKLAEKTHYAIWITLSGLAVNIAINLLFMPRYGYMAAAVGHACSYGVMILICALLGHKHYPIPYNWRKIILYLVLGGLIYGITLIPVPHLSLWYKMLTHTLLLLVFLGIVGSIEYKNLKKDLALK